MTTIAVSKSHSVAPRSIAPKSASRAAAQPGTASSTAALAVRAKVGLIGAIASVPPITVLHMSAAGPVEPTTWTISDYVVTLPYGIPLFAMTTGALAIGAVVMANGLTRLAGTRTVRALLVAWAAALVAAAVFPTNLRGTPQNISSNVHLIAGAVVFALLPVAGWLLARWQRSTFGPTVMVTALRTVSMLSGLLSTALIVNRMPGVIGLPELLPPGILQRAAGAVEIALLAAAAASVLRAARRSQ